MDKEDSLAPQAFGPGHTQLHEEYRFMVVWGCFAGPDLTGEDCPPDGRTAIKRIFPREVEVSDIELVISWEEGSLEAKIPPTAENVLCMPSPAPCP